MAALYRRLASCSALATLVLWACADDERLSSTATTQAITTTVAINGGATGRTFDGVGAISGGGGNSRLNVSQASAKQRAGRCGRVASGVCVRLYAEDEFERRPAFTDPEVLRSSLANGILRMKSLGLSAIEEFPFIDPPAPRAIQDGYALLAELGAVDEANELTPGAIELAERSSP